MFPNFTHDMTDHISRISLMYHVSRLWNTLFSQSYAAPDHVYRGDACPCGSLFPVLDVIGRTDDILSFPTPQGRMIQILPLAIATVAEDTPGVYSCQIIQTDLLKLKVRLTVKDTVQEQFVWEVLLADLSCPTRNSQCVCRKGSGAAAVASEEWKVQTGMVRSIVKAILIITGKQAVLSTWEMAGHGCRIRVQDTGAGHGCRTRVQDTGVSPDCQGDRKGRPYPPYTNRR